MSAIEIKNLKKRYGKKLVLDIESLKIGDNESVGVFGANGSGKSTLIKCLTGLLPYEGGILVGGKNIAKDPSPIKDVGILVEDPALYKTMTGRENIEYFCEDTSKLEEYAKILEVENILDKKVRSYSLGMKQKIGILLACVKGKKIVILDEPFNCLDIISIEKAINLITLCKENGASVILTSHQLEMSQKVIDTYYLIKDTKIYVCSNDKEGRAKVYSVEFANSEDSIAACEALKNKGVDCEQSGSTLKIRIVEGDIFDALLEIKAFNVKKFEDISNSVKEAYLAMEKKK